MRKSPADVRTIERASSHKPVSCLVHSQQATFPLSIANMCYKIKGISCRKTKKDSQQTPAVRVSFIFVLEVNPTMLAHAEKPVPPLVLNAKNPSPSKPVTPDDTMVLRELRAERYRLKSLAADLLIQHAKINNKTSRLEILKHYRTIGCMVTMHRKSNTVKVHVSNTHGKAFYSGLQQCASVWACPVCSAKIQIKRAEEIKKAFKWAYETGQYKAVMITLTFPHGLSDELKTMITKNKEAIAAYKSGKAYQNYKKKVGYVGAIRSLEVTYGTKNGWHPHHHEVWIVDKHASAKEIKAFALNQWRNACRRAGLLTPGKELAFETHSVNVIDNARESDYLAKQADVERKYYWGADKEMAKSSTKLGKGHGMTAFQLLAGSEENLIFGDKFVEFALTMRGSQQTVWSHGLKALVGVDEKSDKEITEEQEDTAVALAHLNKSHWYMVVRNQARAEILDIAESKGFEGLQEWFADYGLPLERPKQEGG